MGSWLILEKMYKLFVVTNKTFRIKRVSVEWGSTVVLNFLIHCIVIVFLLYLFCSLKNPLLLVCNKVSFFVLLRKKKRKHPYHGSV